ncbi:hypothetical protein EV1_034224 [Malus domestica]
MKEAKNMDLFNLKLVRAPLPYPLPPPTSPIAEQGIAQTLWAKKTPRQRKMWGGRSVRRLLLHGFYNDLKLKWHSSLTFA